MVDGDGRTLEWASFNKPTLIEKGAGNSVAFDYGPDRARYRKVSTQDNSTETTLYLGKAYERVTTASGQVLHKFFVYAEGQLTAIHIKKETGGAIDPALDETNYLHRDALGSIDTVTNEVGLVVERTGYAPFGARRYGDWSKITSAVPVNLFTNRGFTGHEHLDNVGLIHMNGRVYDPRLGRFLSADPNVQAPHSSQSYNRYSYVLNNPLKYTDPSGYFFKKLFKNTFFMMVASIVLAYVTWGLAVQAITGTLGMGFTFGESALLLTGAGEFAAAGAISGFATGLVMSGGNLEAAAIGGITGAALGFIGGSKLFGEVGQLTAERVTAHGAVGGLRSEAIGGKFVDGFFSSAFAKSASGQIQANFRGDPIGGAVASAVVGGAATSALGGKFANGATSGAFAYLFNAFATGQGRLSARRGFGAGDVPESMTRDESIRAAAQALSVISFFTGVGGFLMRGTAGLMKFLSYTSTSSAAGSYLLEPNAMTEVGAAARLGMGAAEQFAIGRMGLGPTATLFKPAYAGFLIYEGVVLGVSTLNASQAVSATNTSLIFDM